MTATSLDLSQIKTDALSSAATFRNLIGLGSNDAVTFKEATLTSGTVTSSTPLINATQTWNDAATTFTGLKLDVTNTASASTSLLMDLQVGGTSRFKIQKDGKLFFGSSAVENNIIETLRNGASRLVLSSDGGGSFFLGPSSGYILTARQNVGIAFKGTIPIGFSPTNSTYSNIDTRLYRDAANTLAQRRGTNAQTFRLYNTYTSSTSFESLQLQWNNNEARIGTSVGSAGGTQRRMILGTWNATGTWSSMLTVSSATNVEASVGFNPSGNNTLLIGNSARYWKSIYCNEHYFSEIMPPTTPPADRCIVYAKDNGSGKTQLVVLMPDGIETVLATET